MLVSQDIDISICLLLLSGLSLPHIFVSVTSQDINIHLLLICFIGNLLVSFDLYYPINLVTTFSWPPTRDTRNYQLLVICHARSNKKNHKSCVKIVKLLIKKLLVFFFRSTRIIRSISDSLFELTSDMNLIILVLRKKILIININQPHFCACPKNSGIRYWFAVVLSMYKRLLAISERLLFNFKWTAV